MGLDAETVTISRRFNGPRESGNGGYSSGVIAGHLGGPVEVSLRSPVPLEEPLELTRGDDGALRVLDGETLVAEARSLPGLDIDAPAPVSPEEARRASERYRGLHDGPFSNCFVCGLDREDSFGVFAGEVDGREVVASSWTPPAWAADSIGEVRPEFAWAVLDCPTYFASHLGEDLTLSVLVRQRTEVRGPIAAGEEHVVMSWPIALEGRKRRAGAAVLSADGRALAIAEALIIEPR
jgi:hypothetical protein